MSQTASAGPVTHQEQGDANNIETIKEISQEIIEEKECIIQQIYKQLKASLNTTDFLTRQVQTLKTAIDEIELQALKDQGFIKQENDHYLVVLDLTQLVHEGRTILRVDSGAKILHEEDDSLFDKLSALEGGYKQAISQCQLLLNSLKEKEEREKILTDKITKLTAENEVLLDKNKQLEEQVETLELQLDESKRQFALEKVQLKEKMRKIEIQLEVNQFDDQLLQQNLQKMRAENQQLTISVQKLKSEKEQLETGNQGWLPTLAVQQVRKTNQHITKQSGEELLVGSPQQFMPNHIFLNQNLADRPAFQPKHDTELSECSPINSMKQLQYEIYLKKEESREIMELKETQLKKIDEEEIESTAKQFPEAITDKKDENLIENNGLVMIIEEQPNKEEKTEEAQKKEEKIEEKGKPVEDNALPKLTEKDVTNQNELKIGKEQKEKKQDKLYIKPMRPDKPGKNRKIIRINY